MTGAIRVSSPALMTEKRVKTINIITKRNVNQGEFGKGGSGRRSHARKKGSIMRASACIISMTTDAVVVGRRIMRWRTLGGGVNYGDAMGKDDQGSWQLPVWNAKNYSWQKSNTENLIPRQLSFFPEPAERREYQQETRP